MTYLCGTCSARLPTDVVPAAAWVDKTRFCGPVGSSCHTMGERSKGWRLTPADLIDLYDELPWQP